MLAPNSPRRAQVTALGRAANPSPPPPLAAQASAPEPALRPATARLAWALLLARIYENFPLLCPQCGGDLRIIAFITEPPAIKAILAHLGEPIAPVDLAQAAIGPGMAVYTRYAQVLDAKGKPLTVREALALINQTLDEALAEQEGDFDADSRWALTWFEQSGFDEGEFGVANVLAQAKNTSVAGMVQAGIVASRAGRVRLLKPDELPGDWDPTTDARLTAWEIVHQLIRVLAAGGESSAAELLGKLGARAEVARELAYRLYTLCERKRRAPEALTYNGLVQSWPEIARIALEGRRVRAPTEPDLFGDGEA